VRNLPFYDPGNKKSLIKANLDGDLYYCTFFLFQTLKFLVIKPKRTTQAILEDFKLNLFPVDRFAFGTLLYNNQIGNPSIHIQLIKNRGRLATFKKHI
jgi:hypothetical protein